MARFRTRTAEVEAFTWMADTDADQEGGPDWLRDALNAGIAGYEDYRTPAVRLRIATMDGLMRAGQGDWIVRDRQGLLSTFTPDAFDEAYEPIDEAGDGADADGMDEGGGPLREIAEASRREPIAGLPDALVGESRDALIALAARLLAEIRRRDRTA